ncbi:hypothetical protein D3C87_2176950 [compost metagenome]
MQPGFARELLGGLADQRGRPGVQAAAMGDMNMPLNLDADDLNIDLHTVGHFRHDVQQRIADLH